MQYKAFFSYSRQDQRSADWLHRQLDAFRTPQPLVGAKGLFGPVLAKLYPIFRDRTDLSGGGHLTDRIETAINSSDALIVLCSPAAAQSPWVEREVALFIQTGRMDRIFPVIAPDCPDSTSVEQEFFPPSLRQAGLLAADLREIRQPSGRIVGDGREGGKLKLIAGLLGVGLNDLIQRERHRQRRLVAMLGFAAVVFAVLAVAAAGFGWLAQVNEQKAVANEREARDNLSRVFADRAIEAMMRGDYPLGARYALAGWQVTDTHKEEFRAVLGRLMHNANESRPLLGHKGAVLAASFSPDGQHVLTTSADSTVRIWDAATGKETAKITQGNTRIPWAHFSADGARAFVVSNDGSAQLADAKTGATILKFEGGDERLETGAVSLDNKRFLTISGNQLARLWDVQTGAQVTMLEGRNGAFSPDGKLVVIAGGEKAIILDSAAGRELLTVQSPGHLITFAAFSPDSRRFVTSVSPGYSPGDRTARVWDASTGRQLVALAGHLDAVNEAAFSPDGVFVVTASSDGTARTWDARTGAGVAVLRGHSGPVYSATYDPSGRYIVTLSADNTTRTWEAATGREIAAFRAHAIVEDPSAFNGGAALRAFNSNAADFYLAPSGNLRSVELSPDGLRFVTASDDGAARIWPVITGREGNAPDPEKEVDLITLDGTRALSISGDGSARLIEIPTRKILARMEGEADWTSAVPSADGGHIAAPIGDHEAGLWDGLSGKQTGRLPVDRDHSFSGMFSPDGKLLLTYMDEGDKVWDAATGHEIATLKGYAATFSADSTRIATGDSKGQVFVWEAETGRQIAALAGHTDNVTSLAFSPDGKRLIAGSQDWDALVWDIATAKQITPPIHHQSYVNGVAFSPDGSRVVTASGDLTVRVSNAVTGAQIALLRGHEGWVMSAAFSADGARVVSGAADGTARVWDTATGKEMAQLRRADGGVGGVIFDRSGEHVIVGSFLVFSPPILWDVSRLVQPMDHLSRDVCENFFLPTGKRFSDAEIAADPLIKQVWLRDGRTGSTDICGAAGSAR